MPVSPEILKQLTAVPQAHGVYLWKSVSGTVLYVGKAKQLRSRMRQYTSLSDERAMIPLLMEQAVGFDYIVTSSEHESLILEKNLINQYDPPFNVDFKDDKSYPFIALTRGDVFPAIKYTREKPQLHTRYFGPYTDARAAREMVDTVRRVVPICRADCAEWKRLKRQYDSGSATPGKASSLNKISVPGRATATATATVTDNTVSATANVSVAASTDATANTDATASNPTTTKPCFDYHVGLGPGPCSAMIDPEQYSELLRRVERFLSGHRREFIDALQDEIAVAAVNLEFERAARAKKRLDTITSIRDQQSVVLSPSLDIDCIGAWREETIAGIQLFSVREGNVIISNDFILDKGLDVSDAELLRGFILRYYQQASSVPRELVLDALPEDAETLEAWLSEQLDSKHGAKVRLVVPLRGEKKELLTLAERNARHALSRYKVRTQYDEIRINRALLELESALALPAAPMRIECYDISTIHGRHSVASMVVFNAGRPDKSQYRRFKIRQEFAEANDFAMMSEVLARRFAPERRDDTRFAVLPNLVIVDGGKPQLTAACTQLAELGLRDIPVAGLAKRDEELFVPWDEEAPVILPSGSAGLYLVKRVRDEAHRFAITYHRELRGKAAYLSVLDDIAGLGSKRKKLLLKAFGSLKQLRQASQAEIAAIQGIPLAVAEEVYAVLHQDS